MVNCRTTKFLSNDEILLSKNTITINDRQQIPQKSQLNTQLYNVLNQKPNVRFLGFRPRLWYYYRTLHKTDSSVITKFLKTRIAEPPVLMTNDQGEKNSSNLENFLHSKGYFSAVAGFSPHIKKKIGQAEYVVTVGPLTTMKEIIYRADDSTLLNILLSNTDNTNLKPGNPLAKELFDAESFRITRVLQNQGYYSFNPEYIRYAADTTGEKNVIVVIINNPPGQSTHKVYSVRSLSIFDNDILFSSQYGSRDSSIWENINYHYQKNKFYIAPQTFDKFIFLRTDSVFQVDKYIKTINKINRLDITQLVKDDIDVRGDSLDIRLYVPANKRYVLQGNFDLNYSTISDSIKLFGVIVGGQLINKNAFGNGETLINRLNIGTDFNLRRNNARPLNNFLVQLNNEVNFPKFIDLYGFMRFFNKLKLGHRKIISDVLLTNLQEEAQTRLTLNYEFSSTVNYLSYHSLLSSLGFKLVRNQNSSYVFTPISINVWLPKVKPRFQPVLDNNVYYRNSISDRLFTGFIFQNFGYDQIFRSWASGAETRLITTVEFSGHEILFGNWLWNQLRDTFTLNKNVEFAQYGRFELDIRRQMLVGRGQTANLRLSTGVAFPFGTSSNVPYIKQFYLGGPFSVRGWAIRELGPGSFIDTAAARISTGGFYYQQADFKLEFNAEYRFPIFWRMAGTIFLDGGNIWSLRKPEDDPRPGARLSRRFLGEVGLSSGMGLRFDFSYFVFRLDIGSKIKSPYRIEERYYPYTTLRQMVTDLNFNIALGMPF